MRPAPRIQTRARFQKDTVLYGTAKESLLCIRHITAAEVTESSGNGASRKGTSGDEFAVKFLSKNPIAFERSTPFFAGKEPSARHRSIGDLAVVFQRPH